MDGNLSYSKIELYFCIVVVAAQQIRIILHGAHFSSQAAQHIHLPGLSPGWIPSFTSSSVRKVDLSDHQWREFRSSLPLLTLAFAAFLVFSWAVKKLSHPPARPLNSALFYCASSLALLLVLHGAQTLHVITLALLNLFLCRSLSSFKYGLAFIWLIHCLVFLAIRATEGLPFSSLSHHLTFLDESKGMMRWWISYNLLLLRMISYAVDVRETKRQAHESIYYLAYLFYPPLYIAGPIITYSDFMSQLQRPAHRPSLHPWKILTFGLRWIIALLSIETLTHVFYFNSIAKHKAWDLVQYYSRPRLQLEPLHYAEGSYWILVFMWLKFLVIWRFFRLMSLADGIDPPENMLKCVCNNYTIQGFWQSWHSSYNKWLVSYLYIPLGGSKWRLLNVWVIFTFVALWHDLELKMLGWAWIMALAMMPEIAIRAISTTRWAKEQQKLRPWMWEKVCALCATVNILVLMAGNLVGFVVGLDGLLPFINSLISHPLFVCGTILTLVCAVHIMFRIESRRKKERNL